MRQVRKRPIRACSSESHAPGVAFTNLVYTRSASIQMWLQQYAKNMRVEI